MIVMMPVAAQCSVFHRMCRHLIVYVPEMLHLCNNAQLFQKPALLDLLCQLMWHRQIHVGDDVHFVSVLADMSGELKRELIDRPVVHDMPFFVRKVVPAVIDQLCTYAFVVAPIC